MRKGQTMRKFPKRRPLILEHDEMCWLLHRVASRIAELDESRPRVKKYRELRRMLGRLRRKLWKI